MEAGQLFKMEAGWLFKMEARQFARQVFEN